MEVSMVADFVVTDRTQTPHCTWLLKPLNVCASHARSHTSLFPTRRTLAAPGKKEEATPSCTSRPSSAPEDVARSPGKYVQGTAGTSISCPPQRLPGLIIPLGQPDHAVPEIEEFLPRQTEFAG
eukprot:793779-Pelagomonas_calceolata.AAC.4